MRRLSLITTLFVFILTSSAWAADISGDWTLTMSGRQGEESMPMNIKASGGNLTVTATHSMLQAMEGTGTLKGNEISFSLKATGQMPIEFAFTGTVTGNKMSGTREVKMSEGGGGRGGAQGGEMPQGQGGEMPEGASGRGEMPQGQGGEMPQMGGEGSEGGRQGGQGGQQGGQAQMSNEWSAVKN